MFPPDQPQQLSGADQNLRRDNVDLDLLEAPKTLRSRDRGLKDPPPDTIVDLSSKYRRADERDQ
jgi:hypothetical protein